MNPNLLATIATARLAVTARLQTSTTPTEPESATTQPPAEQTGKIFPVSETDFSAMPEPRGTITLNPLSRFTDAETVAGEALESLSSGARTLWELLHATAIRVAAQRGYSASVSHVVYQCPQRLLAGLLQVSERHTYRLVAELETAGLIQSGAWAAEVQGRNLWATTLFAVKTSTTDTPPRLTGDDFQHKHRDFASDLKRKNTVQHVMSHLYTVRETMEKVAIATNWAVAGVFDITPVDIRYDIPVNAVRDAVHSLGVLADCSRSELPRVITQLGNWLAEAWGDTHSRLWYYSLLWSVAGEWEQIGALQAQFMRVISDIDEYGHGIHNPRAWLNARVT